MQKPQRHEGRSDSDAALVQGIADGNVAAFEVLVRRHNQRLFRAARAILRDDAEAEDVVQEAYLQAYGALKDFRTESKLSTWLVRIAVNEALMRLRKRARRADIMPLHPDADDALADTVHEDMSTGPELAAQRAEMRRLLEMQIDALPETYRIVFVLRGIEELSVEETAEALGIPAATVRSRFFRARSLLREGLASKVDLAYEDAFAFAGERCDRITARVMQRISQELSSS